MMDDLRELYQTTILDHNRNPRNFGICEGANRSAEGNNPICGDQLKLYLRVDDDDSVVDLRFDGSGVREFPMRVKCATLCWYTLRSALDGDSTVAHTE